MGNVQTNNVTAISNVANDITTEANAIEQASCVAQTVSSDIIINDSTIKGNVTLTQQCPATLTGTIQQSLSSIVNNTISAMVSQLNKSSGQSIITWPTIIGVHTNIIHITQNIQNKLTTMMDSTCGATSATLSQDSLTVINDTTIGGNLVFSQGGDATANCNILNVSKTQAYNVEQAKTDQSNASGSSLIAMIIGIIFVIVIAGIIMKVSKKKKKHK